MLKGSSVLAAVVHVLSLSAAAELAPDPSADQAEGFSCPVRLLDVVPIHEEAKGQRIQGMSGPGAERLVLREGGLEYLASLAAPLHVVPVLGVYRGGKSLLLNRLMELSAPYTGGFGVGHAQQTFTRGIDICGQSHEGLGTVVWMDTEGLFSSEDARSAHGQKIFSLALLFSSVVLLNNVKVLNEQFFAFFSEQQQLSRVLKQGLVATGLPVDGLLPANLSVVWILQQPIHYQSGAETTRAQLKDFLSLPGDETRSRVKRDFHHSAHEVPVASYDSRLWGQLDRLLDEELLPEYLDASQQLRQLVLEQLQRSRPLSPAAVAAQLRMYVDLVQTESFSGALAREAFEEAEMGTLCDQYGRAAAALAGSLPSATLQTATEDALQDLETRRAAAVEAFHLSDDWLRRLERCLQAKREELGRRNAEEVLAKWKVVASGVAEEGSCYFLGRLAPLQQEFAAAYEHTFSQVRAQADDYAAALQRTRLAECVRLRDFLLPMAPWLIWPICHYYLRESIFSGLMSLALHMIVLAGLYAVLQFLHQLPPYLDVDYPVLRAHPAFLSIVMRAPPTVPWAAISRVITSVGLARSIWKLSRHLIAIRRPAGQAYLIDQLVNLEMKLNNLLKRSEAMFKQELIDAAYSASEQLEQGEVRSAARSLMKLLCVAREVTEDWTLGVSMDAKSRQTAAVLLGRFPLPPARPSKVRPSYQSHADALVELVGQRDWDGLLVRAVRLLELLTRDHSDVPLKAAPTPLRLASEATGAGTDDVRPDKARTEAVDGAETVSSEAGQEEQEAGDTDEDEQEEEDEEEEESDEENSDEDEEGPLYGMMNTGRGKLQGFLSVAAGCGAAAAALTAADAWGLLPAGSM